ncbi:ABC transporter substrate-binding protein [Aureimonas populi]|uniref:ABC transporter substrate-binding protein n=1 Tax=Aureimonas populi TaxID=1701758 RepID=A0ABW5CIV3_9HYPH|nr:ABC transporter substrate-binding protein [Aureimonas populi]
MKALFAALLGTAALVVPATAQTVKIGAVISETGPGASLGIPEANSLRLLPTEVDGHDIQYIILDDGSDATRAVTAMRKLVAEDRVDAVIGSSVTPASLAMVEVAGELQVPTISLAGSAAIVTPVEGAREWMFKTAQNDALMAGAIADHMAANEVETVGIIAFSDSYGDNWISVVTPLLEEKGIEIVASERYARTDTSVTGQMLRVTSSRPDAVFVIGAGTPAVLPQQALVQRNYQGLVYQTHGVANSDFLRVGGAAVNGAIMPVGPVVVAEQLPDDHPSKEAAVAYKESYEAAHGAGSVSAFGSYAHDAGILLQNAIPVAARSAEPGTPEFRAALRDALEGLSDVTYVNGVATMSPTDHIGQDERARVIVTIEDGGWKLLP